jgi:hypothetical protein
MKAAIAMMIECFIIPRKYENDSSSSQFGCVEAQPRLLRHRSTCPTSGSQNASVTSSTLTKKTHTYRHCLRHSLQEDTVAPHEVRNCTIGSTLGLQWRMPGADEVLDSISHYPSTRLPKPVQSVCRYLTSPFNSPPCMNLSSHQTATMTSS